MIFSLPHRINWCSIPYKPVMVQFLSVLAPLCLPHTCLRLADPHSNLISVLHHRRAIQRHCLCIMPSSAVTIAPQPRRHLCITRSRAVTSLLPCATILQLVPHSPPRASLQPVGLSQRKTVPSLIPSVNASWVTTRGRARIRWLNLRRRRPMLRRRPTVLPLPPGPPTIRLLVESVRSRFESLELEPRSSRMSQSVRLPVGLFVYV
jgi:hypothetical protein